MMIVYIAERRNAVTFKMFFQADRFKQIPYQITHCFRAIEITALMNYTVKLLGELIIKRYGESFHVYLLQYLFVRAMFILIRIRFVPPYHFLEIAPGPKNLPPN